LIIHESRLASCEAVIRRGGSGSREAVGTGGEPGAALTGAGAAGSAAAIDAVCVGAASWTRLATSEAVMRRGRSGSGLAGTGAETGGGLTGGAGSAVAIDSVRVGAAAGTNVLVLRRSWTKTPAASAAKSVMGTMSVDFIVMGRLSSILPKES
jgi:hypothetical protein